MKKYKIIFEKITFRIKTYFCLNKTDPNYQIESLYL